jgi:hypothetical protein
MKNISADENLVSMCGLYCGAYKSYMKDKCKGCVENLHVIGKMPADIDIYKTISLGMQIVTGLVKQISGRLDVTREGGTEFKITFTHKNFRK